MELKAVPPDILVTWIDKYYPDDDIDDVPMPDREIMSHVNFMNAWWDLGGCWRRDIEGRIEVLRTLIKEIP